MDLVKEVESEGVTVVVVPLPAQGHLNQLLHFSRLVSSYGLTVHYVGSSTHNRQAKERVHGWDPNTVHNIRFHDFPLPPFSIPKPNPDASIKFPSHLQPMFDACWHLQPPLASLLRSLSTTSRRVIVVHDSLMSFAAYEASSLSNAEAYVFHSVSAFANLFFQWESRGKPEELRFTNLKASKFSFEGCFTEQFGDFIRRQYNMTVLVSGRLLNTSRAIEGEFVDLLSQEPSFQNQRLFAIGPLNPVFLKESDETRPRHECLEWLDKQPPKSVMYVSFGTTSSMSGEQIVELANGLAASEQRFIWVLRDADRADIFNEDEGGDRIRRLNLPSDYEEKVGGVGLIVRGWAPQLEILAHGSTGGFMSHCGWNSCMESMSMGVPILAWPMHSDQPRNTQLVTEVLKVGIRVQDWAARGETVSSTAVKDLIRRMIVSDEGIEMRGRVQALGDAITRSMCEGGTSRADMDSFMAHITR